MPYTCSHGMPTTTQEHTHTKSQDFGCRTHRWGKQAEAGTHKKPPEILSWGDHGLIYCYENEVPAAGLVLNRRKFSFSSGNF